MSTWKELRELAKGITDLCEKSPSMSIAWPIVQHATDVLQMLARQHEMNDEMHRMKGE